MNPDSFNGKNILHRGRKNIELVHDDEWITLKFNTRQQQAAAKKIFGNRRLVKLKTGYFSAHIGKTDERDNMMNKYRDEEGICHHIYKQKGKKDSRFVLTDKLFIQFKSTVSREKSVELMKKENLKIIKTLRGDKITYLVQLGPKPPGNPVKIANYLSNLPDYKDLIEYAEPNLINEFRKFYDPGDPYYEEQWHLKSWDDDDLVAEADISVTEAWDITRGDRDTVVAIIDDGFNLNHIDFMGGDKIKFPMDFIDNDKIPMPGPSDDHGTSCAGLALAEDNSYGTVGVAPECAFMPVRINIQCEDAELVKIFEEVGKKADVISCSWGYTPDYYPLTIPLFDAIENVAKNGGPSGSGCVICFAAGNYNAPFELAEGIQITDAGGGIIFEGPIYNGLACHPNVVTVSSSTSLNRRAQYSNWGDNIKVCAPSDNSSVYLDPQIPTPGRGLTTIAHDPDEINPNASHFTENFGGTSGATPIVAGVAGLVRSINPGLTADEVIDILTKTADQIVDNSPCPVFGHTHGTYDGNNYSKCFGYGKVNAAKAVIEANAKRKGIDLAHKVSFEVDEHGNLPDVDTKQMYHLKIGRRLVVELEGPVDADFDLYIKRDAAPTTQDFDWVCASMHFYERIEIDDVEPGNYYIMVHSYDGLGDFNLKAYFV